MAPQSRYPTWDVMAAREEWDDHTRDVIFQRLEPPQPPAFLRPAETRTLTAAAARLLSDDDPWRLGKVVEHIDNMLAKGHGNGYRQEGRLPDREFWRAGLRALGEGFAGAAPEQQDEILRQRQGSDFFKTLMNEVVGAYCSLPPVWSSMGYGGPAFPRGYVRIELGLRDPWEAKPHEA
ncbi:MAG TPA: gluconate 2-dehydrogenase subunit 3 family protein [Symbiobacteriaceae bacterium]|nr:gluconate 2-dehydrogenase subunit 3 family protein [Symbiobacteriaceae bacterium]